MPDGLTRMPDHRPLRPAAGTGRPRQALLVLGSHRSGTSAMTGVIGKLGAALPRTLMAATESNPRGHWEPEVIVRIHERLLSGIGRSWDHLAPLPDGWWRSEAIEPFADELAQAVASEFGDAPLFVVKDPRMCRLLPLWRRVLERLGAVPLYILTVRHPLEVAGSLRDRDGFMLEKSLVLWLRHVLEMELETRGARRSFVAYAALLEAWPAVVRRIAVELGLVWPCPPEACGADVAEFLSTELRHHRDPDATVLESPELPAWIRRAYAALLTAAGGAPGQLEAVCDQLRRELHDADQLVGPLLASLHRRERELHAERQAAHEAARAHEAAQEAAREAARAHELAMARAMTALAQRDAALAERQTALRRLQRTLTATQSVAAQREARLIVYEAERATFGARLGRWVTRRRGEWAPVGSLRGRLVSALVRAMQGRVDDRRRPAAAPARPGPDAEVCWLSSSGLFDAAFYLSGNPDVAATGIDPAVHFANVGWKEGRDPHPLFDTRFYLDANPDVAAAGVNPLAHYVESGWRELRDPHPLFDTDFYLEAYPDVAADGVNPLRHFVERGAAERRNPCRWFDTAFYVARYWGAGAAPANPLVHYVTEGARQGWQPHPEFFLAERADRHVGPAPRTDESSGPS